LQLKIAPLSSQVPLENWFELIGDHFIQHNFAQVLDNGLNDTYIFLRKNKGAKYG